MNNLKPLKLSILLILLAFLSNSYGQSLVDGIYMPKRAICAGFQYNHDSWDEYWEGTLKRENKNIGSVTNQSLAFMANYGITNKLNIIVGLPYVWTKATAGTMSGMRGVQDLTLGAKYNFAQSKIGFVTLSYHLIGSYSTPVSNYVADFLPLSIGLQSKVLTGRGLVQLEGPSNILVTLSGAYMQRSNITIDRTSYYTTQQINSNQVEMPNAASFSARMGRYSYRWSLEATFDKIASLSGHDIRRNDMPFPSNNIDMTLIGFQGKVRIKALADLQFVGGVSYVLKGRNAGQSNIINAGLFKAFQF